MSKTTSKPAGATKAATAPKKSKDAPSFTKAFVPPPPAGSEKVTITLAEFDNYIRQAVEYTASKLARSLAADVNAGMSEQASAAASRASRGVPSYDATPVRRAEIDAIRTALSDVMATLRDLRSGSRGGAAGPVDVDDKMDTAEAVARSYINGEAFKAWLAEETDDGNATPEEAVQWFGYALMCKGIVTTEQLASAFLAKF